MRKNTGMAYKRRQRLVRIQKAKKEILYYEKRDYHGRSELGISFDEHIKNNLHVQNRIKKCGLYSKRSIHYGHSSTSYTARFWWSYYSNRDICNAESALSAYDEYGITNNAANRSEAYRKVHNADRKTAKYRRLHV